jgi:hypothetical protein
MDNVFVLGDEEKTRVSKLGQRTLRVSKYLIHLVDSIFDEYLQDNTNLIFIGRSSRPLFDIAKGLAGERLEDRLKLIDLPRILLEMNSPENVFRYMQDNGVFDESSATIIDDGGRGRFMARIRDLVKDGMGADYLLRTYQLLSLDSRNPCRLYEKPLECLPLLRALLFLGEQPHPHRLTGELREDDAGKLLAPKVPTSLIERAGSHEVQKVLRGEVKKYKAFSR